MAIHSILVAALLGANPNSSSTTVLDFERAHARQTIDLLDAEVKLAALKIRESSDSRMANFVAAKQSDDVARLQAHRQLLRDLQSVESQSNEQNCVVLVPGLHNHPKLWPIAAFMVNSSPELTALSRSNNNPRPQSFQPTKCDVLQEQLNHETDPFLRSKLSLQLQAQKATQNLNRINETLVLSVRQGRRASAGQSGPILRVSLPDKSPVGQQTVSLIANAKARHAGFLVQLKEHRGRFAQFVLNNGSETGFRWPTASAFDVNSSDRTSPRSQPEIACYCSDASQIESAYNVATTRVDAAYRSLAYARKRAAQLSINSKSEVDELETLKRDIIVAAVDANHPQYKLRQAELQLAISVRNSLRSDFIAGDRLDWRRQLAELFALHANPAALEQLASARIAYDRFRLMEVENESRNDNDSQDKLVETRIHLVDSQRLLHQLGERGRIARKITKLLMRNSERTR